MAGGKGRALYLVRVVPPRIAGQDRKIDRGEFKGTLLDMFEGLEVVTRATVMARRRRRLAATSPPPRRRRRLAAAPVDYHKLLISS